LECPSFAADPRSKRVFEIGSSLRQARQRGGLELSDVERETRIRSRYLRALEEDRFDLIPGRAYAKGFLRTYADFLGLDADRFVEELAARLPDEHEEARLTPTPAGRRRRISAPALLASLVVVIAAAVILAALGGKRGSKHRASPPPGPAPGAAVRKPPPAPKPPPHPQVATLVLRASAGRCWIEADAGSSAGRRLYYSTLEQGQSLRLTQKRIWLRLGAPSALSATLNGKPVALPQTQSPVDLLVTTSGVQPG
jgi:transcriptional regulator with XRE-family HTH domain